MQIWVQELLGVMVAWFQIIYALVATNYVFTFADAYYIPFEAFPLSKALQAPMEALEVVDMPDAMRTAYKLAASMMFADVNELFSQCCSR